MIDVNDWHQQNGHNISKMATIFNSIPHLQLTNDGLIPMNNKTFDYGRTSYINSLLIAFILPLFILLIIFLFYIIYLFILRFLASSKKHYSTASKWQDYHDQLKRQKSCHLIIVVCGFISLFVSIYGIILMIQGFHETKLSIEKFIVESNNSKQIIKDWNNYLQQTSNELTNSSTGYLYYLQRLDDMVSHYTNRSSIKRMEYVSQVYRWTSWTYVTINIFSSVSMLIYWIFVIVISCGCCGRFAQLKRFILITFTLLILILWMFDVHLVTTMAMSDFCISSKQTIADIAVYKFPENNFSMPFVRYYLDCDISKQWNLGDHKNLIVDYLEKFDKFELFNFPVGRFVSQNWNVLDLVKKNLDQTYQAIGCEHLNDIINTSLSLFCTEPINGLALTTCCHFVNFLLILILLFLITFLY